MAGGFVGNRVFFSPEMAGAGKRYSWVTGGKIGDCWLSVLGGDTTPDGTDVLVGAEPGFRSADRQNFRPAGGFPLIGRGFDQPWMADSVDLAGKARICGRFVDVGAFGGDTSGMTVILR